MTSPSPRPPADHALLGLQARAADAVGVFCVERAHHRLARLYPTPVGVLVEVLNRGKSVGAVWLPDEDGLPAAPSCRCHTAAPVQLYTEAFNFMSAVVQRPHDVREFLLERRYEHDLGLLWVDRQRRHRGVVLPSQAGLPPLMEHLRRGGRVSLRAQ